MIWHGFHYQTGNPVDIAVQDGTVQVTTTNAKRLNVQEAAASATPTHVVTPGLIDLQLNGFVGVDFNRPDELAEGDIAKVVAAQRRLGVTHFLPTVTTNSFEHINKAMAKLAEARSDRSIGPSMPAIHLEGPYFSPEDGPRGAHPKEHVRAPDWEEFQRWQETARGAIRLVTLSAHYPDSPAFIRRLVATGVAASIGHTNATSDQIKAAIDAGATLSTHLGNGSHDQIKRHPNYIWDQLAADELVATLIVDGHHLPPSVVKCMVRAKTPDRVVLISDSVSVAGLSPGRYSTLGTEVELTEDGAVRLAGTPYLSGAALELPQAILNTCAFTGIPLSQAVDMASHHAARYMAAHANTRVDLGPHSVSASPNVGSHPKNAGSFVLYEQTEHKLRALLTVVDGVVVYQA